MTFIPPGEHIAEKKTCALSGKEFVVTDRDLRFYDEMSPIFSDKKYAIPSPKLCPEERQKRRWAFLNTFHFHNVKSSKTGKPILSIFSEDKKFQVYHFDEWYAQDWDACDYGRKFDFNASAYENLGALLKVFPRRNIVLWTGSENCEYVCGVGWSKNCYLISETTGATDCYFGNKVDNCQKCIDCSYCMKCELCYECIQCDACYDCLYCQDCNNCRDSIGLRDCSNVQDCMLSSNIRDKRFIFCNKQLTEEEYRKKYAELMTALNKNQLSGVQLIQKIHAEFSRDLHEGNNENSLGDYLTNTSNCHVCFNCSECSDCRYCVGLINDAKNCMDVDAVGNHIENVYESMIINKNCSQVAFTVDAWGGCRDVYCSSTVKGSKNIFLSTGIVGKEYCVMNTAYGKHEYESLCGHIIDHMISTGEWGEFLPHRLSPFSYNESMAQEYFPMTKEGVISQGWSWYDGENKNTYIGWFYEPLTIYEYDEKIVGYQKAQENINTLLSNIIKCEVTGKPFKIIKQELAFYIENSIPIPRKHPEIRHKERMQLRNSRTLTPSKCSECHRDIITTLAPWKSEKILCKECYQKNIY